jgi:hypothetical protein
VSTPPTVGGMSLRTLFTQCVRPIAPPQTRSAFRFGWCVVAVDGILENIADTDANRTVSPSHCLNEFSRSPFPQVRVLALMECGTHVIFDVETSTVLPGEIGSVVTLLQRSQTEEMLLLCDAGISCSQVFIEANDGSFFGSRCSGCLLTRVKKSRRDYQAGCNFVCVERGKKGSVAKKFKSIKIRLRFVVEAFFDKRRVPFAFFYLNRIFECISF